MHPPLGFLLAFRNRHITVPFVLMLEALWLDRTELFYWLLATGVGFFVCLLGFFYLLRRILQFASIRCFTLPCHCCGHSCGQSWLCFVSPGTDYSSPVPKVLYWASWQPHQAHSMPWSDIKKIKSSQFFFSSFYCYCLLFLSAAAAAGRGCVTFVNCWNL